MLVNVNVPGGPIYLRTTVQEDAIIPRVKFCLLNPAMRIF